jgi:predicted 3-demethylubiquinone-9 3-methyltransferase (glyoxalase superfamily)
MTTKPKTSKRDRKATVKSIVPCLTFSGRTEEAVNFYASVFKDSRIVDIVRSDSDGPIPKGKVLHAAFELNGQEYTAFDGGPSFRFSEAFSFVASCETQDELDEVWTRLSEGGKEGPCGWLTDRFGVSWQVIPEALGEMMTHPESGNSEAVMEALLKMGKIDIKTLKKAYKQR